jgi:hypothetical protein
MRSSIPYGVSGKSFVDSASHWKWYSKEYTGNGFGGCGALSQPFLSREDHSKESRSVPQPNQIFHGPPMRMTLPER